MLTSVGKFLRKVRIDHGEILKDMADKLGVSASFLSAVENGKKKMPSDWNRKICEIYKLSDEQTLDFTKAIAASEKTVEMNFSDASFSRKELAISFARKFSDIDDDQVEKIKKILSEDNKNELY
ncbi:MAG: helix-turn-helix transcriptional regulator [Lactimicrobium sp.]|jgi:transcriptional regulator with XRE-family HTH domain|uniref:helix-turn-helix domain-containing protein n=1 Tax=Lactimicrobium sp. TaxID=2563780 RepID=UPI002F3523BD